MQAYGISPGLVILASLVLLAAWRISLRLQRARRHEFIAGYRFPASLRGKIGAKYPDLTFAQLDRVLEALRSYFRACLDAQSGRRLARQVGMPSRVVDDAWHEFILMTEAYTAFCGQAFGRYLHHTPEGQMRMPMQDALANTLHFTRNELPPGAAGLLGAAVAMPLLFGIDRELGIPGGHAYGADEMAALEARRHHLARVAEGGGGDAGASGDSGGGHCDGASASSCDGGGASCGGGSGCGGGGGCGSA